MSTGPQTKAALDGLYKDVYEGKLESLIPDFGILTKKIKFSSASKTGRDFVKSVKLTNEQGFTYGAGIQTLSAIVSSDVDDAKVRGNSLTLQTGFSYDAAANMVSSRGAFIDATKFKYMAMMESTTLRLEHQMLYGETGLGTINGAPSTTDVVISDASWAVGLWAGQEGCSVDFYNAAGDTLRTTSTLVTIDATTKTLTFSTDVAAGGAVDTDILWFAGAKGNEMTGMRTIVSNTGSLFGISGATYSLWSGNSFAVGGNLTLKKIYDGHVPAIGKGLMEDVEIYVSPATFSVLANDQASLRRYNASQQKAVNGHESIEFYGANGKLTIVVHPLIREGEALSFPTNKTSRIGATDITFNTPGKGDEMFQQLATQTGYECRLYSEQAIFMPCPAKGTLFTGITN
jgi:hypothetical protein